MVSIPNLNPSLAKFLLSISDKLFTDIDKLLVLAEPNPSYT